MLENKELVVKPIGKSKLPAQIPVPNDGLCGPCGLDGHGHNGLGGQPTSKFELRFVNFELHFGDLKSQFSVSS